MLHINTLDGARDCRTPNLSATHHVAICVHGHSIKRLLRLDVALDLLLERRVDLLVSARERSGVGGGSGGVCLGAELALTDAARATHDDVDEVRLQLREPRLLVGGLVARALALHRRAHVELAPLRAVAVPVLARARAVDAVPPCRGDRVRIVARAAEHVAVVFQRAEVALARVCIPARALECGDHLLRLHLGRVFAAVRVPEVRTRERACSTMCRHGERRAERARYVHE